jgi:hypothetical protein
MKEGDKVKIGDEEWDVLSAYSRAQAIEDGILVDVNAVAPDLIKNAGIKFHVAMTNTVWGEYVEVPEGVVGQDWKGRLFDILWLFRFAAKGAATDLIYFSVLVRNDARPPKEVRFKAVCGPGDDTEPVITIMREDED